MAPKGFVRGSLDPLVTLLDDIDASFSLLELAGDVDEEGRRITACAMSSAFSRPKAPESVIRSLYTKARSLLPSVIDTNPKIETLQALFALSTLAFGWLPIFRQLAEKGKLADGRDELNLFVHLLRHCIFADLATSISIGQPRFIAPLTEFELEMISRLAPNSYSLLMDSAIDLVQSIHDLIRERYNLHLHEVNDRDGCWEGMRARLIAWRNDLPLDLQSWIKDGGHLTSQVLSVTEKVEVSMIIHFYHLSSICLDLPWVTYLYVPRETSHPRTAADPRRLASALTSAISISTLSRGLCGVRGLAAQEVHPFVGYSVTCANRVIRYSAGLLDARDVEGLAMHAGWFAANIEFVGLMMEGWPVMRYGTMLSGLQDERVPFDTTGGETFQEFARSAETLFSQAVQLHELEEITARQLAAPGPDENMAQLNKSPLLISHAMPLNLRKELKVLTSKGIAGLNNMESDLLSLTKIQLVGFLE
ncbi:hypothetical protein HDU67_010394 [Dinochytrium kinnereticum]|nr:hypothetical protein HDU67_010394 [Dinochytrium kinnereticum]